MMKGMKIEILPIDDAGEALALGIAAGLEYTEGDTEGLAARWGAFEGGRMVGTVALRLWRGMALVSWMAVDERRRGRGVGRLLLQAVEAEAVGRGETRIWATARAPGFYFANGFVPTGDSSESRLLLGPCLECPQYGNGCTPIAATKALAAGV
jgi:GNAT superfamily N-acetyltransferase